MTIVILCQQVAAHLREGQGLDSGWWQHHLKGCKVCRKATKQLLKGTKNDS